MSCLTEKGRPTTKIPASSRSDDVVPARLSAPRLVIGGASGDAGKTLVSMGLIASWRRRGLKVAPFKKGPDYIDAAWLEHVSGVSARNLDTYIMGPERVLESFLRQARLADASLIEGNRGLFDGLDTEGAHSTAELAKLLQAPVILVVDVTKVTRTAAALVLGCLHMDREVNVAGVILNRVAGARHERIARQAIQQTCGIPVVGAIPKLPEQDLLPSRHLGLVTPQECQALEGLCERLANLVDQHVDVNVVLSIAGSAPTMAPIEGARSDSSLAPTDVRLAYFRDSAFTFYYHDNLEALRVAGAQLIPLSSLTAPTLPDCDGLYIGGGFPETHAVSLAKNRKLLTAVRNAAHQGLPIYAECGGLIYLCRSLSWKGKTYPLAGVFPLDLELMMKPQGHGYMDVVVEMDNPFFPPDLKLRGHEFHYTRVLPGSDPIPSVYAVKKGSGTFPGRDGLIFQNVLASYLHLHALGTPTWAVNFVNLAREYRKDGKPSWPKSS